MSERITERDVPIVAGGDTSITAREVPVEKRVVTHTRVREHATGAQRVGILLAFVEAGVLGVVAAMHFGYGVTLGGSRYEAPLSFAAGIVDGIVALALLIAVLLPGGGGVRAGRVLAAQILAIVGVFVTEVALLPTNLHDAVYEGAILVLALASLALIAAPASRRTVERHT